VEWACLDLLNSDSRGCTDRSRDDDLLDDPRWLEGFLSRWGFQAAGSPDAGARASLGALRSLLRRIVMSFSAGEGVSARDLARLNEFLEASPAVQRIREVEGGYAAEYVPLRRDWAWVCAEIAREFAREMEHGEPSRFKMCANPACRWFFYDESRNRSRRWCARDCGNLVKVREFRARRRAAPASSPDPTVPPGPTRGTPPGETRH
jgi:predicted RNA-binding Zn ribbon-like protein